MEKIMFNRQITKEVIEISKQIYYGDVEDEVRIAHEEGAAEISVDPVQGTEGTIDGYEGIPLQYNFTKVFENDKK